MCAVYSDINILKSFLKAALDTQDTFTSMYFQCLLWEELACIYGAMEVRSPPNTQSGAPKLIAQGWAQESEGAPKYPNRRGSRALGAPNTQKSERAVQWTHSTLAVDETLKLYIYNYNQNWKLHLKGIQEFEYLWYTCNILSTTPVQ